MFVMRYKNTKSSAYIRNRIDLRKKAVILKSLQAAAVLCMSAMCTPAEKVYTVKGNTSAEIQSMIDKAFSKGGGKVVVPAGLYEVGSIRPEGSGKVLVYAYDSHWTMFIRSCRNIEVKGITITADQKMINNDGIDFDGCSHVRVSDSHFKTSDDCIILRAMRESADQHVVCEDVIVSDCDLNSRCQTVRLGCPSDDIIRNALFRNFNVISAGALRFIGNAGHEIGSVLLDSFKAEVLAAGEICVVKGCNGLQFKDVTLNGESCPDGLAASLPGSASCGGYCIHHNREILCCRMEGGSRRRARAGRLLTFRGVAC